MKRHGGRLVQPAGIDVYKRQAERPVKRRRAGQPPRPAYLCLLRADIGILSLLLNADQNIPCLLYTSIIGEATSTTVKIGQRGRAEVVVETEGLSCHSSNPDKGVNAVYHMMAVIEEMCIRDREKGAAKGQPLSLDI